MFISIAIVAFVEVVALICLLIAHVYLKSNNCNLQQTACKVCSIMSALSHKYICCHFRCILLLNKCMFETFVICIHEKEFKRGLLQPLKTRGYMLWLKKLIISKHNADSVTLHCRPIETFAHQCDCALHTVHLVQI